MSRNRPLALESLEDRLTPSTSGITWPDGSHLTLSFAPDGTQVGSYKSNLFQALNATGTTSAWQQAILRAFETWAAPANLNVGVVADGGQPIGTSGAVQGDSRFGDIRIVAAPLTSTTLVTNTQFQWSGTTWSGDIVVNSAYRFSLGGANGAYDLYTCMLNEAGNVFGVLDSHTDTASGVYYQYVGAKTGIDANDLADIKSLYGSRSPDQYEAASGNNSMAKATNLGLALTGINLQADITTPTDVDYYKFSVPLIPLTPVLSMNVQLGTSDLSSLVGSLQVFNASGQLVGSATASDPLHGDLTVNISGGPLLGQLLSGGVYYARVAGSNAAFGVGAYKLTVSFTLSDNSIIGPIIPPLGTLLDTEINLNSTISAALQLTSSLLGGQKQDARFDYAYKASINGGSDVDYYKVQAPTAPGEKMNVLVWALEANRLLPRVDVYTSNGTLVPSTLLANENGTFSVEVDNATSGGVYYVKVSALTPGGGHDTGNYFFGVDFTTQPPTAVTSFDTGTLTSSQPQTSWTLSAAKNQLYEFALSATASAAAQVEMDIYDAGGNLVFTLQSTVGMPANTGHVYLRGGTYTVRFSATTKGGASLPTTAFSLAGRIISDPIGPQKDTGLITTMPAPNEGPTVEQVPPGINQPYYA